MANIRKFSGLTPIRHITGAPWNGQLEIFYHSTADASAIYKGSIVEGTQGLAATGYSDPLGVYQSIMVCADDSITGIVGVAWSFGETPQLATRVSNLNAVNYCPASTAMYVGVITDPTVVFEVSDNGGTAITAAQIGSYISSTGNADGNATTGRSCGAIDQGKIQATHAMLVPLRILRLVNRPDNEIGTYAHWEVMLNTHVDKVHSSLNSYRAT